MGTLKTVFNSREFDLNDDVLVEFDDYFDKEYRDYNIFSLDEEDILALRNFAEQIRYMDSDSTIYVCTYGYEITNRKGEKSTYADTLWIDTVLPVSKIEELIKESGVAEPSEISFVKNSAEYGNGNIWLVTQDEQSSQIIELTDCKQIGHMAMLYWD